MGAGPVIDIQIELTSCKAIINRWRIIIMCTLSLTEASELFMSNLRSSQAYQDSMAQAKAQADAKYERDMAELEALFPEEPSEYKDSQTRYVDGLIDDCENNLYDELLDYMNQKDLYVFYQAVLVYVRNRISYEPLSINNNELTFYVIYNDLRQVLKSMHYTGGLSKTSLIDRLEKLCDMKLLGNLTDDRMTSKALYVANKIADNVSRTMSQEHGKRLKTNRRNHYVLYDLSLQNQLRAMDIVATEKKYNLRQKDKTATSLSLFHGKDNGVIVQRAPNINPTKLRNFINAANILLKKQGYYTERQLRIQYMKKDRRIKKDEAIPLTREYLASVNRTVGAVRARVNKDTRKNHSIPSRIKSNTVIYICEEK